MSKWTPTPVDKDYIKWLDERALKRESGENGKGDDIRPYSKRKYDEGWDRIFGKGKRADN